MASNRLALRPYQEECLERAKEQNTIVSLPTNKGKTLIAARLIEHYLELFPGKKIAFLVPTCALVEQQSRYCETHCSVDGGPPRVLKMTGNEQAGWRHDKWNEQLQEHHILLGTPAVLVQALVASNYIYIGNFSLLVFDECHQAKGNSPMAQIMQDAVKTHLHRTKGELPRILGLTASIINGKIDHWMEAERQRLEAILLSNVFCPQLDVDPSESSYTKSFAKIDYDKTDDSDCSLKEAMETHLDEIIQEVGTIKHAKAAVKKCIHVFEELGGASMLYYIEHVIIENLEHKVSHLQHLDDDNARRMSEKLKTHLPKLRLGMALLSDKLRTVVDLREDRPSPKLLRLLLLLEETIDGTDSGGGHRGIVFVEQIALVSPLAKAIEEHFEGKVGCGAVAGASAQKADCRQKLLDSFACGKIQVLVSTNALEEGIDIPECNFVVRYSKIPTTKGHIQGSGRARHQNAKIYYFENCPEAENQKEAKMLEVARNESLALCEADFKKSVASTARRVDGKHPYPFGESEGSKNGGMVNVFNAKDIMVRYCSSVLLRGIDPQTELYQYVPSEDANQNCLLSVSYPTPDGWKIVTDKDYMEFWRGVDMEKVFSNNRAKSKSEATREEMRFVYLVVVRLREEGLLDMHNHATAAAKFEGRRKCPLRTPLPPDSFGLKNRVFPASNNISPTSSSAGATRGLSVTNELQEFKELTLCNSQHILHQYVSFVLGEKKISLQEDLFGSYAIDEKGKPIPQSIRFPTPGGWVEKNMEDYYRMWDGKDLSDQLNGERKSRREKRELGFYYLAVDAIEELGHLDEGFKPFMTSRALGGAREKCSLGDEDDDGIVVVVNREDGDVTSQITSDDLPAPGTSGAREGSHGPSDGGALMHSTVPEDYGGQFDDDDSWEL